MSSDAPSWRREAWRHPVRTLVLGLIRLYQRWISPALPPSCRFYPSCSAYTFGAIERYGVIRGIGLGAWRIARCNPWNPGGIDHVPTRGPDGRPLRASDDPARHRPSHTV